MTDLLGRYGVLRLLSNKTRKPVTSFPVDSDVLTFGRDTTCDVRMYFTFVSPLHAKLVFENGQAFLSVMGMQGIVVNGSVVMPSSRSGEPIILPLQDQAEFTIHNKTFRFEYPSDSPHPFRVETPPRKSRKSLRMSMINAARVISPDMKVSPLSPSLEVLQSPIKPYGDVKSSAERDLEVILAEGDDVTVSKQGNDLVIVESIGDSDHDKETEDFKSSSMDFIRPQREQSFAMETPRTPTRPKTPTSTISTLHKAVLVRNSRLAMIDREDEEEVFKAVSPERNSPPEEEEVEELDELEQDSLEEEGNPVEHTKNVNDASYPENEEDEPIDQSLVGEGQDHEYHEAPLGCSTSPRPSLLRASLGAIGNVLAAPFSITWDASESEPAEQPQDVAHRDASGVVAPEEKQDETPGSLLDHSMETVEDEEYPPVTESETEPPNHLDESDPHSPSPASQIGFPSPSRAPLSPTKPRSQSLETGVSETTLLARRNRNSAFGLPERWIRNAAPEPNERPEESNLPDNTPIQPATFSTPVKVASFTAPFTAIPSSTPLNSQPSQTPTLESLRKQAQKFEIDNANRATRLSFGHTPTLLRFQSPSKQYAEARRLLNIDGHEYPEESEEAASSTSESASDTSESPVIAALSTMDASGLATPTRHHSQPSSQLAPKTPSFAGFRSLFAPVPREAATPSYQGMRKMFQIENPQAVPPTPSFAGMNDIFTQVEVAEIEDIVQAPNIDTQREVSRVRSVTPGITRKTRSSKRVQESVESVRSSTTPDQDDGETLSNERADTIPTVVERVTPTTTNTRRSSRTRSAEPIPSSSRTRTRSSSKQAIEGIPRQPTSEIPRVCSDVLLASAQSQEGAGSKRKKSPVDVGPAKPARVGRKVQSNPSLVTPEVVIVTPSIARPTRIPSTGRRTRAFAESPTAKKSQPVAKPVGSRVSRRTKRTTPVVKEESEDEATGEAEEAASDEVTTSDRRARGRLTPSAGEPRQTRSGTKKSPSGAVDKENEGMGSGEGGKEGQGEEDDAPKNVRTTRQMLARKTTIARGAGRGTITPSSQLPRSAQPARRTRSAKK